MIGDILLVVIKVLHQQVFCIHNYRTIVRKDLANIPYKKCEKCGRVKDE